MSLEIMPQKKAITKDDLVVQLAEHDRLIKNALERKDKQGIPPFEETRLAAEIVARAQTQFQFDNFDAIQADLPVPVQRPYILTMHLWNRAFVWVCTRCGTGTVSGNVGGAALDGRDLHDQWCPNPKGK